MFQPGQVKPKTIKCVFVPSPLITQHYQGVRAKTGRLGVRIKMSEWSSLSTRRLLFQRVNLSMLIKAEIIIISLKYMYNIFRLGWKLAHLVLNTNDVITLYINTYDGWKSQPETQSVWPSPVMMISPLGTDHIFQWWSSLVVANIGLRGCSLTLKKKWLMYKWAEV